MSRGLGDVYKRQVNTYGVATAINMNGWKLWGNYTGAFPSSGDAKDIWLAVRRMFNWHGNNFIQTYFEKVDDPMNHVLIESIIDSENIRCAAYAPDKWAGAEMQYLASDNPITDTLAGKITFRQRIAPYTPAQEIDNILSYDTDMLKKRGQSGRVSGYLREGEQQVKPDSGTVDGDIFGCRRCYGEPERATN